jgi:hypothetical protein
MRYRYNRGYRYRLTNPPKALFKARMDNIAIVPASMLPLTETLKEKVNTLPRGGVFLCYAHENSRQRKILEPGDFLQRPLRPARPFAERSLEGQQTEERYRRAHVLVQWP